MKTDALTPNPETPAGLSSSAWLGDPHFVNTEGVKWWKDESTTRYAANKIKNATVWIVETPNGVKTRLLLIGKDIVADHQSLEAMACKIDMLAIA